MRSGSINFGQLPAKLGLGSAHTGLHKFYRHFHTRRDLLRSHAAVQEALADYLHVFADFNDMPVRVVEAHNALTPCVFLYRVDIAEVKLLQLL